MELSPELVSEDAVTREKGAANPGRLCRALGAICPHCGSRAKHGERIGCCSGCKTLFTSMSAFDLHRRNLSCLDPAEVGLEPKVLKTDPSVMAWGWKATESPFGKGAGNAG